MADLKLKDPLGNTVLLPISFITHLGLCSRASNKGRGCTMIR